MLDKYRNQPGNISGEEFDRDMKDLQIGLEAQAADQKLAGIAGSPNTGEPIQPKTPNELLGDILEEQAGVLPAGAVIGANVEVTSEGLREVDPRVAQPLGSVGLHGEGADRPQ